MSGYILSFIEALARFGALGVFLARQFSNLILSIMEKRHILTEAEEGVCEALYWRIAPKRPVTAQDLSRPRVLKAMVGLVGAGKTTIAQRMALTEGGVVVSSNTVRDALREAGIRPDERNVRLIVNKLVSRFLVDRGIVVIDSDHIRITNQQNALKLAEKFGAKLSFVRVVMDLKLQRQRILATHPGELFTGQTRTLKEAQDMKLREFERQMGLHYDPSGTMRTPDFPAPVSEFPNDVQEPKWFTELAKRTFEGQ